MRRVFGWLRGRVELGPLLIFLAVASGFWAFFALLEEVREGETLGFDERILLALRAPGDLSQPVGPPALHELMRDFTALGGVGVLTLLTLVVAGFLSLQRNRATAVFLLAAVGTGILVSTLFKEFVARPRPDLVPHGSIVGSPSFPSGHSLMATLVYLTLAITIARTQSQLRIKTYVVLVAVALSLAVGISRVYLGVHWPSDVLAGWALGAAWALGCWGIAEWLERRRRMFSKSKTVDS
ncbi:phosphatase PAP2 family protein [Pseudorhodobacter sp.]|uniref:phosphatase PAP2 family protein n=1 Tax=Pseudorhodobacter sp. TaxID=1934400 RepID=UPI0026498363|nr:phosphatase PAP2 family protein [Pseudorhodobacter sp.]MDN5788833.1 phosphatase PAP2 family protein [Pseudorhodobacter sp.]